MQVPTSPASCAEFHLKLRLTPARNDSGTSSAEKTPNGSTDLTSAQGIIVRCAVLAVSAFRKAGWVEETPGVGSRLEIEVREPAVKHTVTLAQLRRWVDGATRSPVERIKRERMRQLLYEGSGRSIEQR